MKSLLSYSYATSDILKVYQQFLSAKHPDIYFVQPTLYNLLNPATASRDEHLSVPSFEKYAFVFWSINISNTHWVTGVHSNRTNQRLYYADTWGTLDSIRARMPTNLLEKINYFLSKQQPPAPCTYTEVMEAPPQQENSCGSCVNEFARRLGEGTFFL